MEYAELIRPTVFSLRRYNDSNMYMHVGDVSVLHRILTPHLLGEFSRVSFQDEGVNVKVQGFMVVLFKVH